MSSKIKDIARIAGVSVATVSLALNDKKGVNEKTKKKILEIARELDYTPNMMAKGLIDGRTNNIAVFMSGPQYDYFNSPFYFETLKHFARGLADTPFNMVLHIATVDQEYKKLKDVVSAKGIDAILLMGLRMPLQETKLLVGDLPCLFINQPNDDQILSVNADYEKGTYLLTRHLIELGHQDIAFFGSIPNLSSPESRLKGYKKALEEAGIGYKSERVIYADYYQEAGYLSMRKLLQSGVPLPTGIIAGNDLIALGILEAVYDAGMKVPEDLSVAGIDNIPNTHLLRTPLTTVNVRHDLIGEEAARKLTDRLHGEQVEKQTFVDVQLIIRETTAPPRS